MHLYGVYRELDTLSFLYYELLKILAITSNGGGHTDMHFTDKINLWCSQHAPGLKIKLYMAYNYGDAFWCCSYCFLTVVPIMHQEIIRKQIANVQTNEQWLKILSTVEVTGQPLKNLTSQLKTRQDFTAVTVQPTTCAFITPP